MAFICGRMQNPLNIKTRKSDSREPDHSYIKPTTIPATYTDNWYRLPLSGTIQVGWRLRWEGRIRRLLRFRCRQAGALDRKLRIARKHGGVRWRTLTEGYNYTQGSQGNLLFFQHKSQEGKDLQERKGGLFAVSFSEKSSLPLPK